MRSAARLDVLAGAGRVRAAVDGPAAPRVLRDRGVDVCVRALVGMHEPPVHDGVVEALRSGDEARVGLQAHLTSRTRAKERDEGQNASSVGPRFESRGPFESGWKGDDERLPSDPSRLAAELAAAAAGLRGQRAGTALGMHRHPGTLDLSILHGRSSRSVPSHRRLPGRNGCAQSVAAILPPGATL